MQEFIGQYKIDNNIPEPENSNELPDEWFIKEYKRILKDLKSKKARSPSPKSITHDFDKPKKERNLMKGRSDLKKVGDKYTVDTEINIRKGLEPKIKRALKKSVNDELDKKISGSGIRKINLDYSSSEEEKPKRRRPKKAKGLTCDDYIDSSSDSDSDKEDIKDLGKMLSHLISHIKDPKEPIDPKDYKQSIELIKKIKAKKR